MTGTGAQKYRSKGRILADILRAIQEGGQTKFTHILYRANLSHERLTRYLDQLEETNLITIASNGDKRTYSITEKGIEFLVHFHKMEEFAEAFGLDI